MSLTAPVTDLRLAILRPDPDTERVRPKELKAARLELCAACVGVVWAELETALAAGRGGGDNRDPAAAAVAATKKT